jgi:hypothetical protein
MASVHSNRPERRAWRQEAFALLARFLREFDPDHLTFVILKKEGMSWEDVCKRIAHDPDCDLMMEANNGAGLAGLGWAVVEEARHGNSAPLEEKLRQLGRSTDDT